MSQLLNAMRWDTLLLHRNRLFIIAGVLALTYVGIFFLLKPLGNLSTVLVILIMNDPVVTGFVFAGVLWIFDKQQNTLQALAVAPLPLKDYLLSKCIILALLGAVTALVMAWATMGANFEIGHLFLVVFIATFMFACFGFVIAALAINFNRFLIYMIPWFIACGIPTILLFDVEKHFLMLLLPSTGMVELLQATVSETAVSSIPGSYIQLIIWTVLSWLLMVSVTSKRM